jgi:hypothetical protein
MGLNRRIATVSAVSTMALGALVPAAASAWTCPPPPPPSAQHCNSGNGNGSDPITFVVGQHCYGGDPGNSYNAGNKGGDEIPTSGGVPNPGGNNVP